MDDAEGELIDIILQVRYFLGETPYLLSVFFKKTCEGGNQRRLRSLRQIEEQAWAGSVRCAVWNCGFVLSWAARGVWNILSLTLFCRNWNLCKGASVVRHWSHLHMHRVVCLSTQPLFASRLHYYFECGCVSELWTSRHCFQRHRYYCCGTERHWNWDNNSGVEVPHGWRNRGSSLEWRFVFWNCVGKTKLMFC